LALFCAVGAQQLCTIIRSLTMYCTIWGGGKSAGLIVPAVLRPHLIGPLHLPGADDVCMSKCNAKIIVVLRSTRQDVYLL